MTTPLEFREVRFGYDGRPVLDCASFALAAGAKLGLVGDMGAGKTTLLHLAVGLLRPERGSIVAFGIERRAERDFIEVRRRIGLIFQDPDDQLFCPTVLEDVAFGPLNLGQPPAKAVAAAREALDLVGLPGFESRVTYRLSGGEKRLVALATVLAMRPEVLLLDEPQNGLDRKGRDRVAELLKSLPLAMIVVAHDSGFLAEVTSERLTLESGRLIPL